MSEDLQSPTFGNVQKSGIGGLVFYVTSYSTRHKGDDHKVTGFGAERRKGSGEFGPQCPTGAVTK